MECGKNRRFPCAVFTINQQVVPIETNHFLIWKPTEIIQRYRIDLQIFLLALNDADDIDRLKVEHHMIDRMIVTEDDSRCV